MNHDLDFVTFTCQKVSEHAALILILWSIFLMFVSFQWWNGRRQHESYQYNQYHQSVQYPEQRQPIQHFEQHNQHFTIW